MVVNREHSIATSAVMEHQTGFTLIELIVVIFLIATLMAVAGLNFSNWRTKYKVEAQVKEMAADINELRLMAMTSKKKHSITLNANSYVFRSYSSDDEPITSGTILTGGTHNVSYGLKSGATTSFNNNRLEIDQQGLLVSSDDTIIYLDRSDVAFLNCLTLQTARTNVGSRNATWSNCDDR